MATVSNTIPILEALTAENLDKVQSFARFILSEQTQTDGLTFFEPLSEDEIVLRVNEAKAEREQGAKLDAYEALDGLRGKYGLF